MDLSTKLSYQNGTLPDRYWYQLNGKSATENYIEQRLVEPDDEEGIVIKSEVTVKWVTPREFTVSMQFLANQMIQQITFQKTVK